MSGVNKHLDADKCRMDIKTEGLRGIRTMLRAVLTYKPRYWVIENVHRSAPWITDILGIKQQVAENGSFKKYTTQSKFPEDQDKNHPSYRKTKQLAKICFKKYGRPILLHAGAGSGGRYFFGHFPPFAFQNNWIKKKTDNLVKKQGSNKNKIRSLGNPATRSQIDVQISKAFAKSFKASFHGTRRPGQVLIDKYIRRNARRIRRLGIII